MKNKIVITVLAVMVGVIASVCFLRKSPSAEQPLADADNRVGITEARGKAIRAAADRPMTPADVTPATEASDSPEGAESEELSMTPEERAEAAAEAKVEAFDNLTDKWMEPSKQSVSMKDIDAFRDMFRKVPKERKDECIHRALNLIPDENVMLLAGILMDKSEDKEIVETVFNDVLNRDEDVKKPILKQIFADKTHPCWADTAWIFDVTGEKANASE